MFTNHNQHKGFVEILGFLAFVVVAVVSAVLFVAFFKYHITIFIYTDAQRSKTSLIPLLMTTRDYDDESFSVKFNRVDNNIESGNFREELNKTIKKYYLLSGIDSIDGSNPEYTLCYELTVLERKRGFDNLGNSKTLRTEDKKCDSRYFTRMIIPVPVTFDGMGFTKKIEFKTFKFLGINEAST